MNKLRTLIPMEMIEQGAINQIYNILKLDFVEILAIMPDVHQGYTLPIGGVALMDNVISPECIGLDIGCGMCMLQTNIDISEIMEDKDKIFDDIIAVIPVGFKQHESKKDYKDFKLSVFDRSTQDRVNSKLYNQLGTLGGGNHFLEIGYNKDNKVCITIHSGSRGVGNIAASYYINLSKQVDKGLPHGFLHLNSDIGKAYTRDLEYFTQYALDNRLAMMESIKKILGVNKKNETLFVNENHNFADIFPDGKVRHRKGATPAELDQIGVIPANMKDGVFVTRGLGNEYYLSSSSHGAGRKFSRGEAKRQISIEDFKSIMGDDIKAIITNETLDESPMAYKDINQIISMQEGINIEVIDRIMPVINIKGAE